ncbi:methionine aminopeptidase [Candidatus Marinamargulisbacteria bacterium SCGC AG-343-D04]|nr:methionine aminopeptidase [Candidatus Marinamargulisbacteria bacterium SCGC AG-343-D04]
MEKKIQRNDPCWCGSEKKYKKCHSDFDTKLKQLKMDGYPIPPRRIIKTPDQINGIRKSCQLTKSILDDLNDLIKPGITSNEINQYVHRKTLENNAIPAPLDYKGFPKSICTSINEVVCHGIPSERVLKEGDIVNVDVTCILDGYYGDSCRMYPVGKISKNAEKLVDVTKQCLEEAIKAIKPFGSLNIIGETITRIAKKNGYGVVHMFGGHGVGNEFHEEPFIYHSIQKTKQMICAPGMIFTIEPMINEGTGDCEILDDDWTAVTLDHSLSAQWEHTVCIHEDRVEILT